jgi:hypothetical protein
VGQCRIDAIRLKIDPTFRLNIYRGSRVGPDRSLPVLFFTFEAWPSPAMIYAGRNPSGWKSAQVDGCSTRRMRHLLAI